MLTATNFLTWPAEWLVNADRLYRLNADTSVKAAAPHACEYPCNGHGAYVDSWREVNSFLNAHSVGV